MKEGAITLPNEEEIHFREINEEFIGKEPSILFVHGNTAGSIVWVDTMENLKEVKRHLIAVDLRGFGKSSWKKPCDRFLAWAQDLKQFCSKRGITKCIANGWSFGGEIVMKLAQIAPELVAKIILTCSYPIQGMPMMNGEKECRTAEEIKEIELVSNVLKLYETKDWQGMLAIYHALFNQWIKDYSNETKQALAKNAVEQRCFIQVSVANAHSDIQKDKIKADALIIHGGKDIWIPPVLMKQTQEHFKNFVLFEDNNSYIPRQSPQQYKEHVIKFIEEK